MAEQIADLDNQIKEQRAKNRERATGRCQCGKGNDKSKGCLCSKSKSVFILKASKRQVYNVNKTSLTLLEPVMDIPNNKVGLQVMNKVSKSTRHGSTSCRSLSKTTTSNSEPGKIKQESTANGNFFQFQVPLSKLNSFASLKDSLESPKNSISETTNSQSPSKSITDKSIKTSPYPSSSPSPHVGLNGTGHLYNLYIADGCTVPGSCICEPDKCACPNCLEHNFFNKAEMSVKQMFDEFPFPGSTSSINEIKDNSPPETNDPSIKKSEIGASKITNHIVPYGHVELQTDVFNNLFPDISQLIYGNIESASQNNENPFLNIPQIQNMESCVCPPEDCACFNCEIHGISNGVRRDGQVVSLENDFFTIDNELGSNDIYSYDSSKLPQLGEKLQVVNSEFPISTYSRSETASPSTDIGRNNLYDSTIIKTEPDFAFKDTLTPPNGACCNQISTSSASNAGCCSKKANKLPPAAESCCGSKKSVLDNQFGNTLISSSQNLLSQNNIMDNSLSTIPFDDQCICPDDQCDCDNCFRHGKLAGINILH
ncbi:hypothetical protein DAMA08_040240 [Martiniozyma asiatica (nom. inval.)]|nr:hypothetical protein DAMA08_040240 [Martiniozyma asiatica]